MLTISVRGWLLQPFLEKSSANGSAALIKHAEYRSRLTRNTLRVLRKHVQCLQSSYIQSQVLTESVLLQSELLLFA